MIPFSKICPAQQRYSYIQKFNLVHKPSPSKEVFILPISMLFDIVGNILLYIGSFLRHSSIYQTPTFSKTITFFKKCLQPIFSDSRCLLCSFAGYLLLDIFRILMIIDGWSIPYALLRPWIGWSAVLIALSAHVWKPQRIFFVLGVVNAWIALQDFSVRSPSNKGISVLSWNVGTPSIGTKESQSLECVFGFRSILGKRISKSK